MEISKLSANSLKIKGKTAAFVIDPEKASSDFQAALYLQSDTSKNPMFAEGIAIDGPGEFEVGGVKIKGIKKDQGMIYTLDVDGMSLIIGNLSALEKVQGKFQDLSIACVFVDGQTDPSFMSGFVNNYIVYFGEKAEELNKTFLNNEAEKSQKVSTTKDKLPQEMQTIQLV